MKKNKYSALKAEIAQLDKLHFRLELTHIIRLRELMATLLEATPDKTVADIRSHNKKERNYGI